MRTIGWGKKIPISAAREIAEKYGYDQVVIIARAVGVGEQRLLVQRVDRIDRDPE